MSNPEPSALDKVNVKRVTLMAQQAIQNLNDTHIGGALTKEDRERLQKASESYLDELQNRKAISNFRYEPWGEPKTPILVRDQKAVQPYKHKHIALFVWTSGKVARKVAKGTWRKSKKKLRAFLSNEIHRLRDDVFIQPVQALSYITLNCVHHQGPRFRKDSK